MSGERGRGSDGQDVYRRGACEENVSQNRGEGKKIWHSAIWRAHPGAPPALLAWLERWTPIRRVSTRFQSLPDRSPALRGQCRMRPDLARLGLTEFECVGP